MNNTRVLERQAGLAIAQFIKSTQTRNLSTSRMIGIDALRPSFRHVPSRAIRRPNALPRCPKSQNAGKSRFNSTNSKPTTPDPTPNLGSPEPAPSLSQRLRKLSREYGWTAVGVYFALSALDFPFCFLAVRALGTDRIGRWEHNVVTWVKSIVAVPFPGLVKDTGEHSSDSVEAIEASVREGTAALDDQLIQAQKSDATIWTQLGLAYAIHKSFIFVRVPLTAAVLPKVVKQLRKWGFDIGKRKPKPAK